MSRRRWTAKAGWRPSAGWRDLCLRVLLTATLFSALQGWAGAIVTAAWAHGPVVEICTPLGMQWVTLDAALQAADDVDTRDDPLWPQGLAKPCAWAWAHVSLPAGVPGARAPLPRPVPEGRVPEACTQAHWLPAAADRVLLNAPMRAPPAIQA